MAININKGGLSAVTTSTYIAFVVIILFGMVMSFTLLPPSRIVRSDGSLVKLQASNTVRAELSNLWASMKDRRLLLCVFLPPYLAHCMVSCMFHALTLPV